VNTLNRAREIKEEQLISMIKITIRDKKKYVVLFLEDKKNEYKPINKHQ
jgi:hypothetical protein